MPGNIGQLLDTLASLDSALAVTAGATANGTSKGLGVNTSPQSVVVAMQFAITNAGSTDGFDLDVVIQFSDDDTNWPDAGEGLFLTNFFSAVAGDDIALSAIKTFVPKLRYFRAQYTNNNGTDNLTVSSEEATHLMQFS